MLTKADGAIDWARPAAEVAARIRGVDPWPGAQAKIRGETVKLFGARIGHGHGHGHGHVSEIGGEGMLVGAEGGSVWVREIQFPGGKRMKVSEAAKGKKIAVGDQLERP
jgi:methionyl-tRNA formyltransferase